VADSQSSRKEAPVGSGRVGAWHRGGRSDDCGTVGGLHCVAFASSPGPIAE
jgi:hypothetical protein